MFQKTTKTPTQNPRSYTTLTQWTWLVCTFFVLLTGALLFSSWLFLGMTESLDAPALPTFESNAARIRAIDASVLATEEAIIARVGQEESASQNGVEVIE